MQYKRAVGLYHNRIEAERVVRSLRDADYDMDRVSVIAKDGDRKYLDRAISETGNKADEGATTGALTGGALGGITGLLVGLGVLAIPGVGPVLLAGMEATAIATAFAGGAIGAAAGGLVGALIGLGIPEEKARLYNDRVERGSFLIMVTGTPIEINRASSIMHAYEVDEFEIYDATASIASPELVNNSNTSTESKSLAVEKEVNFENGEIARIEVYEELVDITKQVFVVEEINVRKEIEQTTIKAQETVRREELDIKAEGNIVQQ